MNESPIVKCSHCKQILPIENFDTHECNLPLADVRRIPVVYFQDDSVNGERIMTGRGIDGVLYNFVVTPRTAIPYIIGSSDDSYHDASNRRRVTRTEHPQNLKA
jgi:hypothetical protein